MEANNEDKHKKWLQKRKYSFIAFSIQMIIIGMEWSLTVVTLWSYIKEMITTNNPKLIYGLVSVSYMFASTITTPFVGRYVDRRRNINTCFLICNMYMLIGNVIYSLPFSPLFLIGGRVISGFGGALKSIIYSETIRSYQANEISSKLSVLSMMVYFGFMLGPGINFFFKNINFFIGDWHLQYVNFPGIFLSVLCFIMEILTMTMVYDISKELDYITLDKNSSSIDKINELNIDDIFKTAVLQPKNSNQHSVIKILKVLFFSVDSALVLFSNFFIAFFFINTDIWLPLLIIEKMSLSVMEINICYFGVSGICAILLIRIIYRPFSDEKMMVITILSLVGFCIVSAGFIILSYIPDNKALNILMSIVYMTSYAGAPIITDVYFVSTLAKMVNSNVLTFVDSVRSSSYTAGAMMAFSFSAFIFDYVAMFGALYIVILVVIAILFICRKKHFINPKLII
ncbi:uncharacterized protein LOC124818566 [Hydra vulgaris]|uniref:uncharacterized protein LOC124818566 n=1 Tax=Hydra vulgaris TaxID=6087 RepID=UPI001F5F9477|nr:uncharacterized protein LOC124818566 [Hydra vulgaris]